MSRCWICRVSIWPVPVSEQSLYSSLVCLWRRQRLWRSVWRTKLWWVMCYMSRRIIVKNKNFKISSFIQITRNTFCRTRRLSNATSSFGTISTLFTVSHWSSMVLLASHILTHQDDNRLLKLHNIFHDTEVSAYGSRMCSSSSIYACLFLRKVKSEIWNIH